jgi:hypothetical protein
MLSFLLAQESILCKIHFPIRDQKVEVQYADIEIDNLKQNEREVKINGVNHIIVY